MTLFEQQILFPFRYVTETCFERNSFFINGRYYTYSQFVGRISTIRGVIQSAEIDESIWALRLHDDLDTYAAIFALWMEGKAYVPLHPSWPEDRLNDIIDQIGCHNIFDSEHLQIIATDSVLQADNSIWKEVSDDALAYILFTSGSTGEPKGVQISRQNIAAFVDSFYATGIHLTQEDRCLQCFDLTFDVSVQSFLLPLLAGACVYTVPYGGVKYLYAASLIQEQQITFGAMAPSMLTYLRPYFRELDGTHLKSIILTAEACPLDLIEEFCSLCATNATFYDFYGPTEATIYCTYYQLLRNANNLSLNGIVSIGKPFKNVHAIIMREDGSLVEEQEKGELCVAGAQVTPGYWKNEEKNKSSFFLRDGVRYYHTGDLCYWDKSGNIMYSGRIDQQAKIQGFRVELGEIEHHARQFYNGEVRVVAVAFQNQQNLTEIALFVEKRQGENKTLLDYLGSKMPHYMVPTRIIYEPTFPLNKSDKVDRQTLKIKLG